MSGHANLRVRFYPSHGEWTCVVQEVGPDGMPVAEDRVSGTGDSKEAARHAALEKTSDREVAAILEEAAH